MLPFVAFAIASLVVVAVFVVASLQAPTDIGTQYLKECPTSWPSQRPGPNTTHLETLAAMTVSPGTTAAICVEHSSGGNYPVTAILNSSVYYQSNMSSVPPYLIHVSAQPNLLKAPELRGQSPSPVAYAVFKLNISSSAQGFYMLALDGICPQMPLAIGYSQINYTDFANGWQHRYQCTSEDFFGSYVSVNNVDVAYSYVPLGAD